ncbi:SGNH/GDSL hydrolase family protein [Mucilaginibacter sp. CSA2-8R]|uniref:SGNH/GDSL hydrolase family protein n=1 Tax=Mucilaginibacter sp. CSA2-8R TaxID=3141542 RepID=UPI00315C8026
MSVIFAVVSCKKQTDTVIPQDQDYKLTLPLNDQPKSQVIFKNIVILGNSITIAPITPAVGWNTLCGMAASTPDSDYVHRLTVRFKQMEPNSKVTVRIFNDFESAYINYDFNKSLKDIKEINPDLVIVRVGENVDHAHMDAEAFRKSYQKLVQYFTADGSKTVVLSVGPLWSVPAIDKVYKLYTPYVSLSAVSYDRSNLAYGLFSDIGVQQHPCNKGMRVISNLIWNEVVKINPYR